MKNYITKTFSTVIILISIIFFANICFSSTNRPSGLLFENQKPESSFLGKLQYQKGNNSQFEKYTTNSGQTFISNSIMENIKHNFEITFKNKTEEVHVPPLNSLRIISEFLGSWLFGGVLSSYVGKVFAQAIITTGGSGCNDLGCAIILFSLGMASIIPFIVFGPPSVTYLIGNIGEETGSYKKTVIFGCLGLLLGAVIASTAEKIFDNKPEYNDTNSEEKSYKENTELMIFAFFLGPAITTTIGFNMTRRYKKKKTIYYHKNSSALINIENSLLTLSFPNIQLSTSKSQSFGFNLFQVSF